MIGVFKKCMTTDFANFSGRARRREYWLFALAGFCISLIFQVLGLIAVATTSAFVIGLVHFLSILASIAMLIPSLAVCVRRLHDTGKSGLWLLILLVPFVGAIVVLVFELLPGNVGDNKYGADPKQTPG